MAIQLYALAAEKKVITWVQWPCIITQSVLSDIAQQMYFTSRTLFY